jgi:hypothetical protein
MKNFHNVSGNMVVDTGSEEAMKGRWHSKRAPLIRVEPNVSLGYPYEKGVGDPNRMRCMDKVPTKL